MQGDDRYDSLFRWYAQEYSVPWTLLKAMAKVESALDPDARSHAGAVGLLQFMENTWREWWDGTPGVQRLPAKMRDNPEAAIRAAAAMVSWLLKQFGNDVQKALAAYNWGFGRLRRCLAAYGDEWFSHLPLETYRYVQRVPELAAVYAAGARSSNA